jgi:hypothetical protein
MGKNGGSKSPGNSGGALGFEGQLWAAADKMRGHMDASEYKHVCLGLIFLKYIPPRFLHLFLVQPQMKHFLAGLDAGAARQAVTKGQLEALEVLDPPADIFNEVCRTDRSDVPKNQF